MNLPVMIDVAIGLVFIFLILSLLTSEIQELVTILLQWRAEHLKRSIENLFTGDSIDDPIYQEFTDKLYNSSLIKALNQEAKGRLAVAFRKSTRSIASLYYAISRRKSSVFRDQKSGPSYIPADTFAVALLQQIHLKEFSQKIGELTARKFKQQKLEQIRPLLDRLYPQPDDRDSGSETGSENYGQEYQNLQQLLDQTIADFVNGRSPLSGCLDQISAQLLLFLDSLDLATQPDPNTAALLRQFAYIKQTIAQRPSEPTVTEVLRLIFNEDTAAPNPWIAEVLTELKAENPELLQTKFPPQLQRSLMVLAEQSQFKSKSLQEEVSQLEREVSAWFDRAMERASGVYRRNAKGIAILIGFLIAIATNADTFYMVSRLSKDTFLRSTISQAADQVVLSVPASRAAPQIPQGSPSRPVPTSGKIKDDLESVKTAVNEILDEMPLPVGWNKVVTDEQVEQEKKGWQLPIPQRAIGWFITGIALSMGAAFWYDLLSRVMRVRGTGEKPAEK
jgi:hypothetical protein